MKNQALLFLTNKDTDSVLKEFSIQNKSFYNFGEAFLLFHLNESDKIDNLSSKLQNYKPIYFNNSILHDLNYVPIVWNRLVPGSNHFPLLKFYLENPHYSYYWMVEDDVRYFPSWEEFYNCFETIDSDFISCHIKHFQEQEYWYWWSTLKLNGQPICNDIKLRSFNPIYRISNSALNFLHSSLRNNWEGHHEVLIPTLLKMNNFEIRDFGGDGEYSLKGLPKFYKNSENDPFGALSSGSMRFRPIIQDSEFVKNCLFHPVKEYQILSPTTRIRKHSLTPKPH